MKFYDNEAQFPFNGWSVSVYRNRYGNRLEGRGYRYSFSALKVRKDGGAYKIIAKVSGRGSKLDAIKAIKTYEAQTSAKTQLCTPYSVDVAGAMLGNTL